MGRLCVFSKGKFQYKFTDSYLNLQCQIHVIIGSLDCNNDNNERVLACLLNVVGAKNNNGNLLLSTHKQQQCNGFVWERDHRFAIAIAFAISLEM